MEYVLDRGPSALRRFSGFRGPLVAVLCVAALGSACSSIERDLQIEDDAVVPSLRAIWRFTDDDPLETLFGSGPGSGSGSNRSGDLPSSSGGAATPASDAEAASNSGERASSARPRTFGGFEVDFAFVSGRDDQSLAPGESIRIDNRELAGPTTVSSDFDLTLVGLAYRGGVRIGAGFEAEALVGVGGTRLNVDSDAGGESDDLTEDSYGALLGASLGWSPAELFGAGPDSFADRVLLYGRYSWLHGFVSEETRVLTAEFGLSARLFRELGLFAAYRDIDYRLDNRPSDVSVEVTGPAIGVELRF